MKECKTNKKIKTIIEGFSALTGRKDVSAKAYESSKESKKLSSEELVIDLLKFLEMDR